LPALLNHDCAKAQQETPKAQLQQKIAQVRQRELRKTCSFCHRSTTKMLKPTRQSGKCNSETTIAQSQREAKTISRASSKKNVKAQQETLKAQLRKKNCASPTRTKTINPSSSTKTFGQFSCRR
jgi:hypothetical protein